tara:strand:- start:69 stop:662 length:594 start_codon:yes stop_codon:yes gene_type:complete
MITVIIWGFAVLCYGIFWGWYIGFRKKVTAEEASAMIAVLARNSDVTERQKNNLYHFLANDDGKDFVMVNLLCLQTPLDKSRDKLETYQKIFLGALLRKAGHPVLVARAAGGYIENIACDDADKWSAAGLIRYRSRRDLLEMLPSTIGSEHHGLKLAALEKTFAFPASPWFMFGGPRIICPLTIALIAALTQLWIGY